MSINGILALYKRQTTKIACARVRVREYVCTREELNQCKCMRIKYLLLKRMFLLIISRISEHKIGAWANRQYNKCSNGAFRLITRCRKLVDVKRHVIYVKLYAFFCHFITNFPHANFFFGAVRSFACLLSLARSFAHSLSIRCTLRFSTISCTFKLFSCFRVPSFIIVVVAAVAATAFLRIFDSFFFIENSSENRFYRNEKYC